MGKVQSVKGGDDLMAGIRLGADANLNGDAKAAIDASGHVLVGYIKQELSQPGSGRIRQGETRRLGAGSMTTKKIVAPMALVPIADERRVRQTVGVPRTNIAGASRASAPGEPPAPDSGDLRNSIDYEWNPDAVEGYVGSGLPQAPALNNGTTNAGLHHTTVILPRPFMDPAFAKAAPSMSDATVAALTSRAGDISGQHGPAIAGPAGGGQPSGD